MVKEHFEKQTKTRSKIGSKKMPQLTNCHSCFLCPSFPSVSRSAQFRTKCSPREAMGVACLQMFRCSS